MLIIPVDQEFHGCRSRSGASGEDIVGQCQLLVAHRMSTGLSATVDAAIILDFRILGS